MVRGAKGGWAALVLRGSIGPRLQSVSENADVLPVIVILAPTLVATLLAQDAGIVPRRLVARYDFEESAEFNPGVPVNFYRVTSARAPEGTESDRSFALGYPPFGEVSTASGVGREGKGYAVRFDLDGASMVLGRDVPLDKVPVGSELLVRAWTKTEGLRHASVRVSARYFDADGRPIAGIHASGLVRAETEWRALEVEPPPMPAGARLLQLWLEVVQPRMQGGVEPDRFDVAKSDVKGRAYFDEIEVWQMPSVKFEAEGRGIVAPGAAARIRLRCDDPIFTSSTAEVRVRDASGRTAFERSVALSAERESLLEVPALATGWYEAEAHFSSGGSDIAWRRARFAVLPEDPFEPDQPPRFGASLARVDESLDAAVDLARSAFVVLPVWNEETDVRESAGEIEALRPVVGRLLDRRVEPMFRLRAVPTRLASQVRIETSDALGLFSLEESQWRPALEPWLLAFGQRVDQWFIGSEPVDADRADLAPRVEGVAQAMSTAIAGPALTLPWSPDELVPAPLAATIERGRHAVELVAEPAWREGAGEAYEGFAKGARGVVRVVPLAAGEVSDHERAIDLALRAIDAWRAGFDSIAVDVRPAAVAAPGPALELAAWRQISTRLCGRRFVAEIPLRDGVRALLADGARGTVLVLWNELGLDAVEVSVDLGQQPVQATDLWGRSAAVPPQSAGHALRIGREPLFVEGASREMCLLRSGFRVAPAFAESRRAPQAGELVLANPWDRAMSATLSVLGPGTIELSPRTHRFTIAPRGEVRLPVSFGIPRSTEAGVVPIEVEVVGMADEPFRARMSAVLEIGFRKVAIEPSWRLARSIESGALDLILALKVTNISDAPIDVEAFAGADGYSSDRKLVSGLAPGATATRAFHFKDGARRLSGREIRTGVHETETDARLLRRVVIPPLLPPPEGVAAADSDR